MATENQSASKEAGKTPLTTNTVDQMADAKVKDSKAEAKEPEAKSSEAKVEPKLDPKAEPKAEAKAKPQGIRAVYGEMVDPHTGLRFTPAPVELYKKTPWVQAQIDAKKMELVDL